MHHLFFDTQTAIMDRLRTATDRDARACREFVTRMVADRTLTADVDASGGPRYIRLHPTFGPNRSAVAYVMPTKTGVANVEILLPYEQAAEFHGHYALQPVDTDDPGRKLRTKVYLTRFRGDGDREEDPLFMAAVLIRRAMASLNA